MDLVEARKKARELEEKKRETPEPEKPASRKPEAKKPGKAAEKKQGPEAKAKAPAKKTEPKKRALKKKPLPQPAPAEMKKAHPQKPHKKSTLAPESIPKPAEVLLKKTEPAKPEPAEEAFVDLNFGEDLPELLGKEKKLVLEEKKVKAPEAKVKGLEKKPEPSKPAAGSPKAEPALEKEAEKDFYELVVEDLVQYGYGELEAEADLIELLGFRLGQEIYAVSLVKIQQIIKPRPVTLVPGAPHYILGIVSLRGMIIPIFDLRRRLGLPRIQPTRQSRIIIVKVKENVLAGLYVDQVLEVAHVPQSSFEAPHAIFSGAEGEFLEGIARHKNQMLIVLNLDQVVVSKEEERKAGEK